MDYVLVILSSVNLVNQIKSRLNREGEYFAMIRAPQSVSSGGCGFALRFAAGKLPLVKQTARKLGISFDGIYREERQNGSVKYTLLMTE